MKPVSEEVLLHSCLSKNTLRETRNCQAGHWAPPPAQCPAWQFLVSPWLAWSCPFVWGWSRKLVFV